MLRTYLLLLIPFAVIAGTASSVAAQSSNMSYTPRAQLNLVPALQLNVPASLSISTATDRITRLELEYDSIRMRPGRAMLTSGVVGTGVFTFLAVSTGVTAFYWPELLDEDGDMKWAFALSTVAAIGSASLLAAGIVSLVRSKRRQREIQNRLEELRADAN